MHTLITGQYCRTPKPKVAKTSAFQKVGLTPLPWQSSNSPIWNVRPAAAFSVPLAISSTNGQVMFAWSMFRILFRTIGSHLVPHKVRNVLLTSTRSGSGSMLSFQNKTRSEEHTSELQSRPHLVCRLLLGKKKQ